VPFEDGLRDLTAWVRSQQPADTFDQAQQELRQRGLVV
jgi:hypothetical protein